MIREAGSAPEGSRVANYSKEGKVPNQANPNWKGLASDDQTWDILDSCKRIAEKHGKTVAQVLNSKLCCVQLFSWCHMLSHVATKCCRSLTIKCSIVKIVKNKLI